jgi:hypothetical protein
LYQKYNGAIVIVYEAAADEILPTAADTRKDETTLLKVCIWDLLHLGRIRPS